MGLKNVFKKKELTEQEVKEHLASRGLPTRSAGNFGGREEKFGAFKQYAQDRSQQKQGLKPVNPYANLNGTNGNPYQNQGQDQNQGQNPYANQGQNPYANQNQNGQSETPNQALEQSNPYARQSAPQRSNDPYARSSARDSASSARDPYARTSTRDGAASTRASTRTSTRTSATADPYARTSTRDYDEELLDLNAIPTNSMYNGRVPRKHDVESIDLNELPEDEDLNVVIDEDLPEQQEVNSEDEEVEAIKQDIRFVKQESVASTRNTLRMAQEADASGTNTLGMLGSQSERLYNAEQNLNLADTQSKIAEEKVKQIERYNRSIFIPASGNPFNKKSRLRMQEQKIKSEKAQEKYMRETNRKNLYESEQRIKQGITLNATSSELHQKYRGEQNLASAQRYQFENDSEDDEMEKELASNLDQIALYSKKLKNTANTMSTEVDKQNERLRKIEEDADRLDINVHMNNTRLSHIR